MNLKLLTTRHARGAALVIGALALYGCSSDDDPVVTTPTPTPAPTAPTTRTFDVTVTNLTNAQPLSPIAVVAHEAGFSAFTVGQPASTELEQLAEGGDNSAFITAASSNTSVLTTAGGTGPIGPGGSETVSITVNEAQAAGLRLTVMSMLVNTNDAFGGTSSLDVSALQPQQSSSMRGISYDSGTEANSEVAATIPGPAGGGEGFNAARDDRADAVTAHSGVVTSADGLATSNLDESHRWLNPVVQVTVTRTQ